MDEEGDGGVEDVFVPSNSFCFATQALSIT